MLSALSDSYLPTMNLEQHQHHHHHHSDFLEDGRGGGGRRILSPEDALMPPLSIQDRHPSAPQLASLLAPSVDKASDNSSVMVNIDESVRFSN